MIRVNAMIDEEKQRQLYHLLVDERITFSEWLRRQIDKYIEAKKPKAKGPKGKEGNDGRQGTGTQAR